MSYKHNFFINICDIYGKEINLLFKGKDSYKTLSGSIIGFLSLSAIVSIAIVFLSHLIQRKDFSIIYNQDPNLLPVVNLTSSPFMFSLSDMTATIIPQEEKLFNFEVQMLQYVKVYDTTGQGITKLVAVPILYEKCDLKKHFLGYADMFKAMKYDKYFCIIPNQKNLIVQGKPGDIINGFSLFLISINKCDKNVRQCYDDTTIDSKLSNLFFTMAYLSSNIDHYQVNQPYGKMVQTTLLPVTSLLIKKYSYHLKQIFYTTDYGFIFQENVKEDFFTFDSYSVDVDVHNNGGAVSDSTFGIVSIECSDIIGQYTRTYSKAQSVLAQIGGIMQAVMWIGKIISSCVAQRFIMQESTNAIFTFEEEQKSNIPSLHILPIRNHSGPKKVAIERKSSFVNSRKKVTLSFKELLCPKFCIKKKDIINLVEFCQKLVDHYLHIENLLPQLDKVDKLAKMLLHETEYNDLISKNRIELKNFVQIIKNGDVVQSNTSGMIHNSKDFFLK